MNYVVVVNASADAIQQALLRHGVILSKWRAIAIEDCVMARRQIIAMAVPTRDRYIGNLKLTGIFSITIKG
ncbi:hypothetical protein [Pseudomonas syringae group genomosp. 7]|uniref:hypothetical protein n=1 Tax=Pseudomonas syringae group genomosp. 7 TaxID=251699 RepID=UPI001604C5ED|nr:hypothetical protein [Pseudomonas syringae group genomosp. 7]